MMLSRVLRDGTVDWARGYGGTGDDDPVTFVLDAQDQIVLTGLYNGTGNIGAPSPSVAAQLSLRTRGSGEARSFDARPARVRAARRVQTIQRCPPQGSMRRAAAVRRSPRRGMRTGKTTRQVSKRRAAPH